MARVVFPRAGNVGGKPKQNRCHRMSQVPAWTAESEAMSRDLQRRGFKFVGSTICYALMQATGMVNDHLASCGDTRSSTALPRPAPGPLLAEGYKRETIPPLLSKNDASIVRPEFGTSMIAKFFIQSVLVTGVLSLIGISVQAQVPLQ
jgi:hypothetical protein